MTLPAQLNLVNYPAMDIGGKRERRIPRSRKEEHPKQPKIDRPKKTKKTKRKYLPEKPLIDS